MSLKQNPVTFLEETKEKVTGFLFNSWKRIKQNEKIISEKGSAPCIAVDLGHSHILALVLEKRAEKPNLRFFRLETRPSSPESVSELLRGFLKDSGVDSKKVRIAIKGQGSVIRILSFPQMKKSEFAGAIPYELEKYIPFKSDEVIFDFQILNENVVRGNSKMMNVLLVAAKQNEIYELLRLFQNADLEVELIDTAAFALTNLIEFMVPEVKKMPVGFLDIGAETSTFGILIQGQPVLIRGISFGGLDILKLLKRKLGVEPQTFFSKQETLSSLSPDFASVVEQGLAGLQTELKLSIGYYMDHVAGAEVLQKLLVVGGASRFVPNLSYFEQALKIPTHRPDIFSHFDISLQTDSALLKKNQDLLPVALGLCLRP